MTNMNALSAISKMQSPQTAAARLKQLSPLRPRLAIVLGSGFHHVLTELRVDKKVSYAKIPGFPKPGVSGHAGEGLGEPVMRRAINGDIDAHFRIPAQKSG